MKIGMIGLGKMGANMTERLLKGGHEVVAYDLNAGAVQAAAAMGAEASSSLDDLIAKLDSPKAVWVMLPAGHITDSTVEELAGKFAKGDVIIDGGNSNYKEWKALADKLESTGIGFVDAGTSGGVWGLTEGYCLMVGGTKEAVAVCERACSLYPANAGLRSNLALACLIAGDTERAKADVGRALDMDPADKISRLLARMIDDVIAGKRPRPARAQ